MTVNVKLYEDWDAVAADAADALDRAAQPWLYDRLSWFRLLERHCPPPGAPLIAKAENCTRHAWLPLAREGAAAQAYAAWYSLRFAPLLSEADAQALLVPLARDLRRRGLARVELAPVAQPEALQAAFREGGWFTRLTPATGNWFARTEGLSFEDYWAARPGQLRNTARRKARSAGLDIAIFDRFDPQAWADYEAVYAASWKGEEGSPAFLRALAEQEGAAGTLRLGIARKDGKPVAAQLWLVENGQATIHKLAYDEAAKALSPGTVLGMAMFRHVIEKDRPREIDYGTGDDAYKRDWMDARRQLWRLTAFNPRHPAGLARAARAAASALVARLRRS